MRICPIAYRLVATICLTMLCLLAAGCSSRQAASPEDPASSDFTPGFPADPRANQADATSGPLPPIKASPGQSVFVDVSGGSATFNADLQSMLTAYLQSERQLVPADSAQGADLLLRVAVDEVTPLGSRSTPPSAGRTLGHTATGAMLGALVGGSTGGGRGAAWGVGGGLLLGLGVSMLDGGTSNIWGMRARVGAGRNGKQPQEMYTVSVSAEGTNMGRDDILPALEDKLSNEIVKAVKP